MQKEARSASHPVQIYCKCILRHLNVRPEAQAVREKRRETILRYQGFLNRTLVTQEIMLAADKWDLVKFRKLLHSRGKPLSKESWCSGRKKIFVYLCNTFTQVDKKTNMW